MKPRGTGFETLPEGLERGLQHGKAMIIHRHQSTVRRAATATARRSSKPVRISAPCQSSETLTNLDFQKTPTDIRGLSQLFYASLMRAQPCRYQLDAD